MWKVATGKVCVPNNGTRSKRWFSLRENANSFRNWPRGDTGFAFNSDIEPSLWFCCAFANPVRKLESLAWSSGTRASVFRNHFHICHICVRSGEFGPVSRESLIQELILTHEIAASCLIFEEAKLIWLLLQLHQQLGKISAAWEKLNFPCLKNPTLFIIFAFFRHFKRWYSVPVYLCTFDPHVHCSTWSRPALYSCSLLKPCPQSNECKGIIYRTVKFVELTNTHVST